MNSTYTPVALDQIKKQLDILEEINKQNNQLRASLFNLVVYAQKNDKLEYFVKLADQITAHFPCRVIFIEENTEAKEGYLNAAIAAQMLENAASPSVVCDRIYLSTSPENTQQIHHLLLEHTLIDLPIYLLWGQDPTSHHPLFEKIRSMAKRLIFHSECSNNLKELSQKLLNDVIDERWEVADLNWIFLQEWREVIKAIFNDPQHLNDLNQAEHIQLKFCETVNKQFCHNHFQVHYMYGWLAARLNWELVSYQDAEATKKITYKNKDQTIEIDLSQEACGLKASPGTLLFLEIKTRTKKIFTFQTSPGDVMIHIEIRDEEKPNSLYNTSIIKEEWQIYLSKEICYKETSQHYKEMLAVLSKIDGLV